MTAPAMGVECGNCGGPVCMVTCDSFRDSNHAWVIVSVCLLCRATNWTKDGCLDCGALETPPLRPDRAIEPVHEAGLFQGLVAGYALASGLDLVSLTGSKDFQILNASNDTISATVERNDDSIAAVEAMLRDIASWHPRSGGAA